MTQPPVAVISGTPAIDRITQMRILFFFFILFFLAVFGLCCCTLVFSSCGEQGLLFIAVRGLLIAVASLVAEHGL